MAVTGRMFHVAVALGLLLTASPAVVQAAAGGTGSDASFTPTMRPTHSVPKPQKVPVRSRFKKPLRSAPLPHS